eukprot:2473814-Lingulodinium_polyedra.AAC.1
MRLPLWRPCNKSSSNRSPTTSPRNSSSSPEEDPRTGCNALPSMLPLCLPNGGRTGNRGTHKCDNANTSP